jgi:hypothetical protein
MKTQKQKVLADLLDKRPVTPMSVFKRHNITCLSERIRDLRDDGYNIARDMVTKNGKRYAKYSL